VWFGLGLGVGGWMLSLLLCRFFGLDSSLLMKGLNVARGDRSGV
jgi:hypothetical protein